MKKLSNVINVVSCFIPSGAWRNIKLYTTIQKKSESAIISTQENPVHMKFLDVNSYMNCQKSVEMDKIVNFTSANIDTDKIETNRKCENLNMKKEKVIIYFNNIKLLSPYLWSQIGL